MTPVQKSWHEYCAHRSLNPIAIAIFRVCFRNACYLDVTVSVSADETGNTFSVTGIDCYGNYLSSSVSGVDGSLGTASVTNSIISINSEH
jgi:hypothetical protein